MRVDARSVMIFRLSTTPGTTSCSRPAYRSSVFSRTMTRSTFSNRERTLGRFATGRRFAYRSSAFRSPTLTLVKPSPTGVVTGPFSATLLRRTESMSSSGSGDPYFSRASTPASCRLPRDLYAGCFDDRDNGCRHFGSDAVARNKGDGVSHVSPNLQYHAARVPSRASQKSSSRPPSDDRDEKIDRQASKREARVKGDGEHARRHGEPGKEP